METPFGPNKVHHLIYHVVRSLDREFGAIELMKIIFLIDVTYWRLFGKTIVGVQYIRHRKGPWAPDISEAAKDMYDHELNHRFCLSRGSSQFLKKACSLGARPRFEPELLPEEAEVTRQTLGVIGHLSPRELESLAYDTEPMRAIVDKEIRFGRVLRGTPLDLDLIERDTFMLRWLKNREATKDTPPDEEYERWKQKERRELEELLAQA